MHCKQRLMSFMLACVAVGAVMACGVNQEAVATKVASDWVIDNVATVSEEFARLLLGDSQSVAQRDVDWYSDWIADSVTWTYEEPECESDDRCQVTVTASFLVDLSRTRIGDRLDVMSLPFSLLMDTDAETVLQWLPLKGDATWDRAR